jgi:superfamily I DNA/RNA helicase
MNPKYKCELHPLSGNEISICDICLFLKDKKYQKLLDFVKQINNDVLYTHRALSFLAKELLKEIGEIE